MSVERGISCGIRVRFWQGMTSSRPAVVPTQTRNVCKGSGWSRKPLTYKLRALSEFTVGLGPSRILPGAGIDVLNHTRFVETTREVSPAGLVATIFAHTCPS